MRHLLFSLWMIFCGVFSWCSGQESDSRKQQSFDLRPIFSDHFQKDSLSEYKRIGKVTWTGDSFALSEDAQIIRVIRGGERAKFDLDFQLPELKPDKTHSEFRVWLYLDGATNCFVCLRLELHDGEQLVNISLVDTAEEDDEILEQQVRSRSVPVEDLDGLSIEYRNGLVQIAMSNGTRLDAYIDNGSATCLAVGIESHLGSWKINRLVGTASRHEVRQYTEEELHELDEIAAKNVEVIQLYHQGEFLKAADLGEEVMQARKRILGEQHPDYASSLSNLAVINDQLGRLTNTESYYLEAKAIHQRVLGEQHPKYALTLNNLGHLYVTAGKYKQAVPLFEEAIEIRKRALGEQDPSYATSLMNLATTYEAMSDFERAESLMLEVVELRKQTVGEEHAAYATSLNNLASLYQSKGDLRKAEELHLRAKSIRQKVLGPFDLAYADSANNLGLVYYYLGDNRRAEALYREALAIVEKRLGKLNPDYAVTLNNLAVVFEGDGDYPRAEKLYQEVLDVYKQTIGVLNPTYATSLNNLAVLYNTMGDYSRAEKVLIEAMTIRRDVLGENHNEYASSLNNLAVVFKKTGQLEKAEEFYLKAKAIQARILGEQHPDFADSCNNLGAIYVELGDPYRAEVSYREAVEIRRNSVGENHPEYARNLGNLAYALQCQGEFEQAKAIFQETMLILKNVLGSNHPDYIEALYNLGLVHLRCGELAEAIECIEAADLAAIENGSLLIPSFSQAQAINWMQKFRPAADILMSIWRRDPSLAPNRPYELIWRSKALVSRMRFGQRLSPDASPQAREIHQELNLTRLELARLTTANMPSPEKADAYRKKIEEVSNRKEQLEKRLADENPLSKRQASIRDASINDLKQQLPPATAVIDIVLQADWIPIEKMVKVEKSDGTVVERSFYTWEVIPVYDAFVLKREEGENAAWIQLGDAAAINQAVNGWRTDLRVDADTRGLERESVKANEARKSHEEVLRNLIWDKFEPYLQDCETVVIIPDGDLSRLPWAALPGREEGTYLIHDYAIAVASFGQQLFGLLSDQPALNEGLIAVGGVDYASRSNSSNVNENEAAKSPKDIGWTFLDGTKAEVETIQTIWKEQGELSVLSEGAASEATVAQAISRNRFAHIATHGFFATKVSQDAEDADRSDEPQMANWNPNRIASASVSLRNPLLLSGLVLSGANLPNEEDELGIPIGEDGILSAEEIVGLDLRNLELVTLSACETGLGEVAAGEGVFGLQRAFHQAGARAVVASLWKVSDNATRALMVEFYTNLWIGNMSKVEALRQAQLTMIDRYDLESGTLRGLGRKSQKGGANNASNEQSGRMLSPKYWAAFQISGDWR